VTTEPAPINGPATDGDSFQDRDARTQPDPVLEHDGTGRPMASVMCWAGRVVEVAVEYQRVLADLAVVANSDRGVR